MDRLSGLMSFIRTAELGSFVAAGRALGLSASAVGKGVTRLEQRLGVRLFQRSTRSLSLTDEGRVFQERCRRILDDLDDAQSTLSQSTEIPRGRLRVSMPAASYHLFQSVLIAFMEAYPDIELDLDFSDKLVDVIEEGVDVVIRTGELPDSRLMHRPLPGVQPVLCAAPSYLERHGVPMTPAELDDHLVVRFRYFKNGKLLDFPLLREEGAREPRTRTVMVSNNMEMVRAALIKGFGLGTIPDFLAREALANGSLYCLLHSYLIAPDTLNIVWPSSRQLSRKIRVFVDFMCERLEQEATLMRATLAQDCRYSRSNDNSSAR
ncbi:DNA-binding transcriptional regulator, LysR family [Pseudomonas asplenii]|uniref:DNA-binding transcriptional regulator, LysR family n=1 Tax=Pseudomonas asplenii TaxID=53407 RepID=A0A1H1XTQ6_9PSED|nr:LysR family transcriptional regulator [Pseudomonas asplenii]SDT12573.1 DNA-binding transcriptional regulator, LysR family [Pseudomonas asplenii]